MKSKLSKVRVKFNHTLCCTLHAPCSKSFSILHLISSCVSKKTGKRPYGTGLKRLYFGDETVSPEGFLSTCVQRKKYYPEPAGRTRFGDTWYDKIWVMFLISVSKRSYSTRFLLFSRIAARNSRAFQQIGIHA
jgi:hypothetical protein